MKNVVIPGYYPETEAALEGLGFGFKSLKKLAKKAIDPRAHLKLAKKLSDPRSIVKIAKASLDPRTALDVIKAGGDPTVLLQKKKRRRKMSLAERLRARQARPALTAKPSVPSPAGTYRFGRAGGAGWGMGGRFGAAGMRFRRGPIPQAMLDRMRARRRPRVNVQGMPTSVVLPVRSEESAAVLSDLGIGFGSAKKFLKKYGKKIAVVAAVGTAAYFTGGAILKSPKVQALLKKQLQSKKLSSKAKKKIKELQKGAVTAAEAKLLPAAPGSVAAGNGASPITEGGIPIVPATGYATGQGEGLVPSVPEMREGEAWGGVTGTPSQAGLNPVTLLIVAGLALPLLMMGKKSRR